MTTSSNTPGVPAQLTTAPLVGIPSTIPGITAVAKIHNQSPVIMVTGREKDGKSSLATTLFGYPAAHQQPLIIACDPSGPDSCIALGYMVHAVRLSEMTGARWFDRARSAISVLENNIQSIRSQYGAVIFDDCSTLSYRLLEDQRRTSKNPDPRSHYFAMYNQFNELYWRLTDLGLPIVLLAWQGEPGGETGTELAAPDIAGKRFARTIAGRTNHNFVLEKRFIGKGQPGADLLGYGRLLHSVPWNNQNAGGRYAHLLPEPCPANLKFILDRVTVQS